MARDRGQIYEASDWFKEALQINQVCQDVSAARLAKLGKVFIYFSILLISLLPA